MMQLADGTGAWALLEVVLLSDERAASARPGAHVVRTPLDLIALLERRPIGEVVLGGTFARAAYFRAFLHEIYPRLVVVDLVANDDAAQADRKSATEVANASG